MKTDGELPSTIESLHGVYPNLGENELAEIEDRWCRYVALAVRVYERLCANPEGYGRFRALTANLQRATMECAESDTNPTIRQ